jgi:hypothetical protein
MPATEEEERALGIRHPVYIPATTEKRVRPGTWRIVSGVLSVLLFCVASCGLAGFLGRDKIGSLLSPAIKTHLTPQTFDYSQVPATPTSSPGPAAKYLKVATTARAEDAQHNPVGPTTHFNVLQDIHLLAFVRGVPKGQQHTVWVRWYLNGVDVGFGRKKGQTVATVNGGDTNVFFTNNYPAPGIGMAKLYWDIPDSDSGDAPNDQYLAQTVIFGVYATTPTPTSTSHPSGTPTGTPTGTPKTGTPTATPTGKADMGPMRTSRREITITAQA